MGMTILDVCHCEVAVSWESKSLKSVLFTANKNKKFLQCLFFFFKFPKNC